MIVDSCRDQLHGGGPVVLDYLADLGVDAATQVELIVATHAHDDHFAGIAEVFRACSSARFVLSQAITSDEFFAVVRAEGELLGAPAHRQSAYNEYRQIFDLDQER